MGTDAGAEAGAYVLLEDGKRFDGIACAAPTHAVGEVVFTTGMSGYQESVSDPSFAGQLITFTYPHIGNYGTHEHAMESGRAWACAVIMRHACNRNDTHGSPQGWLQWLTAQGVPAISGVDTRALVRHIRDAGAMRGGLFPDSISPEQARDLIAAEPSMSGRDLAAAVSPPSVIRLAHERELDEHMRVLALASPRAPDSGAPGQMPERDAGRPLVAILDTGVKASIVRNLIARGVVVELHPYTSTAQDVLASKPNAVLLANGPGDPSALETLVQTVRALLGKQPIWGICLGHQLLCRALGLSTFKLPFGHRGANHPVKDLRSGRISITSQNHGFAVLGPNGERTLEGDRPVHLQTDFGDARLSHVNLYDRTVEGIELLDMAGASVQYHPEAGPGPHDSLDLFDRFLEQVA